jgi:tetratricopeptide (TPR) repeat protein
MSRRVASGGDPAAPGAQGASVGAPADRARADRLADWWRGEPSNLALWAEACAATLHAADPAAAGRLLDEACAADPAHAAAVQPAWLRMLHHAGLHDEALAWAAQAQVDRQLTPEACGAACLLALDADAGPDARRWADAALAHDPQQAEALLVRGSLALAAGDPVEGQHWLARAAAQRPRDGRVLSAQGMAALAQGEPARAQPLLAEALSRLPGHVGTWHALGWAHLLQGRLEAAGEAYAQALALDPAFAESHGALGLCCVLAGDVAGAQPHLRRAFGLDPANVTGGYAQALARGETGPAQLAALARRLLARAGPGGGTLADAVLRPR